MNIVLTGFMGTGKSSIGKIIAKKLHWVFFDTDDMIEKETGCSVADLFSKGGEKAFRDHESKTVHLVALLDKAVIATGGGVPLRKSNMDELEKNGKIFCLVAAPETIVERLGFDVTRPLLKGEGPLEKIKELLEERSNAYGRCWKKIITDNLTPAQVAEEILLLIPPLGKPSL